jgi:hypothetical protein
MRYRPTAAWSVATTFLGLAFVLLLPGRSAAQFPDGAGAPGIHPININPLGLAQIRQAQRMWVDTGGGRPPAVADPRLGARVEKPSDAMIAQLDLPRGQGLIVEEIIEGNAAAKAGLKVHDILLELDGKAVPSNMDEFDRLMEKIKEDKPITAVVLRRGKNETIKDLKLPRGDAAPGFLLGPPDAQAAMPPAARPLPLPPIAAPAVWRGGPPAMWGGPPPVWGGGPPAMAGAPFGPFNGQGVLTTTFRGNDRFVTRHQEGSLVITLTGKVADGKAAVQEIRVQDGRDSNQFASADKVPEAYRLKVKNLVELTEKSNSRIDVKTP